MEVSDTLKITLKVGGHNFTFPIKRAEEIYYRNAERYINQRYTYYVNNYPSQSVTMYLLMTLIEIAKTLEKQKASGNLQPVMATLNGLIDEIREVQK